jgi:spore maturation protein CgeB
MRVLYLGAKDAASTAKHRADALRRLGCEVVHHDPHEAIADAVRGRLAGALHYRTGYALLRVRVARWVEAVLAQSPAFDLCWVDNGELLSARAVQALRASAGKVVLFNHDDPTGSRDGLRFLTLRGAIPHYSLCVVVREFNVAEFKAMGAQDVIRVWMGYDEVAHRPAEPQRPVAPAFDHDIAFIGRCMKGEGRDLFMLALIRQGLRPAIWGDNWSSSEVWSELKPYWQGPSVSGQDYVDAMRGAKLCIGMLSKGNRDQHTTRTMEIPAAGGLLCAERTAEHQALYREGEEALFWSDANECAAVCKRLLADPARLQSVREAGQRRVLANRVGNEDIGRTVLAHCKESQSA